MIDPEQAGKILENYFATTPVEQLISDTRRRAPGLAEELGLFDVKHRTFPRIYVRGVLRRRIPARWITRGYCRRHYAPLEFRLVWPSLHLCDLTSAG